MISRTDATTHECGSLRRVDKTATTTRSAQVTSSDASGRPLQTRTPASAPRFIAAAKFALSARGGAASGCHGARRLKDGQSMDQLPPLKSLQRDITPATWSHAVAKAVAW